MAENKDSTAGTVIASPDGLISAERTLAGLAFRRTRAGRSPRMSGLIAFAVSLPLMLVVFAAIIAPERGGIAENAGMVVPLPLFFSAAIGVMAALGHRSAVLVPLVAESSGRVVHGHRTLLEKGAARRIYVERKCDAEGVESFHIEASNRWGPLVSLPGSLFAIDWKVESAVWFARQLGAVIGAEVETSGLDEASGPRGS